MHDRLAAMFLLLGLMVGCTQTGDGADDSPTALKPLAELSAGWTQIFPGGDTLCSDGSAYSYWVRPGDTNKLLFYLQGGGACWFRENCDPAMNPSYTINLDNVDPGKGAGIFDYSNPTNPFARYTTVFVPYCSADVHLGASDTVYPPVAPDQAPLTIHHRGLANAAAAVAWVQQQMDTPKEIFVTGSSAGAIPSPYYAAKLASAYPAAKVVQLGDGAGGYRLDTSKTAALPHNQWGTIAALQKQPGFAGIRLDSFDYEQMYVLAAAQQPGIHFARYDAAEDAVQKRFLALMGAKDGSLADRIGFNEAAIKKGVANYSSYLAGGESHTILGRPEFYTFTVGNQPVQSWVQGLAQRQPVPNVRCSDCRLPDFVGYPTPEALKQMWLDWEDPQQQYVEPFKIFDNLYYVGIDWVAAYVLQTSEGLILIDALYGKWVNQLYENMRKLGLDPKDIRYVIATHGHFDHAGGAADVQQRFGAKVVMSTVDWQLMQEPAGHPLFAMEMPSIAAGQAIVAADGDVITLGDTSVTLYNTPGHTPGVLSLVYPVHDGAQTHSALSLGGVGLNFAGVPQSESYVASYQRLVKLQRSAQLSVSLPNHASMGKVFERAKRLAARLPNEPHPFVDNAGLAKDLAGFLDAGRNKLRAEQNGTAVDPMKELTKLLSD